MAVRIAVDAMGGQDGPATVVRGALLAAASDQTIVLVVVGDETQIGEALEQADTPAVSERVEIVHSPGDAGPDESPPLVPPASGGTSAEASSRTQEGAVITLAKLGACRDVAAVVCTGEVGAAVAACELKMKPLECVAQAGLAAVIPSFSGPVVLCDAGANIQAKPEHVYEYGVMAALYARRLLGIKQPRVSLLSGGEQGESDTRLLDQAGSLLQDDQAVDFVGRVAPRDLFRDRCDVVACDGFAGNIVVRLLEGLAAGVFRTISREIEDEDPQTRVQLAATLDRIRSEHEDGQYGGAPLLGVDGVAVMCRDRVNERTVHNAVVLAKRLVDEGFNQAIAERFGAQLLQD